AHAPTRPGSRGSDLPMVGSSARPELGHVAENGDLAPIAGALGQVLQRGRHGGWVRVVAVVDEHAIVRKGELPSTQRRKLDVACTAPGLAERETKRVVGGERRKRVRRVVAGGEAELERQRAAERRHLEAGLSIVRGEVRERDVAAL